ncbi:bifunctional riboflavin kinase/FAD synthetase [Anaerolineales bacterium HSG6]|nr:bifunctional riboflavin kinase/FAD synthetase [Anaerolineales bacterium HSG6]MDM8533006.1 bifunctional riboflavin kinase/FAD synthetase [Anaerolineales bacterium HSG25]
MKLIQDFNDIKISQPTILTIGTFDGVHRGHQQIIQQIQNRARQKQALSAVLSFHPRPKTVLRPQLGSYDYLTTATERIDLFIELKLDLLLLIPFTIELSQLIAYQFMAHLKKYLNLIELWAGHDFALGKGRSGNIERLQELGTIFDYTVHEIEPYLMAEELISSTRIRQLLTDGQVEMAGELLGRYPMIQGQVEQGEQRGRTIGFPTANLDIPPERLLPANGVYATWFTRQKNQQTYPSVTNIGIRPSFNGHNRTVESYIFDFDEDIYDETCRLDFVSRLRPEKKFDDLESLIQQIQADADQARLILV